MSSCAYMNFNLQDDYCNGCGKENVILFAQLNGKMLCYDCSNSEGDSK